MMLVLPVQTFASAAMMGCAFSHQGHSTRLGQTSHQAKDHQAASDLAVAACHESENTDKSPTSHTCKHCSACYLASALLIPAAMSIPVVAATLGVVPHGDVTFAGFIPDSPERPPRISFA